MTFILDFASPSRLPRRLVFGPPVEIVRAETPAAVRPALQRIAQAARDGLHATGFVAYEAAPAFDRAARVLPGNRLPLVWFGLHEAPLDAPPHAPAPRLRRMALSVASATCPTSRVRLACPSANSVASLPPTQPPCA